MELTEEQKMIREMASRFAREELEPNAARWDNHCEFPKSAVKQMAELGLLGMLTSEDYDGVGADHVSYALAMEEIAKGDASCSTIMGVHNSVGCVPILRYGNDWQKQTFLKPMARGELLACFCLTEPQAGSDASNLKTTACLEGDHYVLNGTKQFVTSGSTADIAIVFAITDSNAGKKGMSSFIVPTDAPGYEVVSLEKKLGQKASDTAQIGLKDLRIPREYLLGEEGEGYRIALSNLEGGRIGIGAQAVGMARAAFDAARKYASERTAFGETIMQHQAVAFRLADMATQIDAAHLMVIRAANLRDRGKPCLREASMAKLFASEMAEKVCSNAIQIHGGYGYVNDFPVERIYRDVRVCQIYEGTSDVQRMVISRSINEI